MCAEQAGAAAGDSSSAATLSPRVLTVPTARDWGHHGSEGLWGLGC